MNIPRKECVTVYRLSVNNNIMCVKTMLNKYKHIDLYTIYKYNKNNGGVYYGKYDTGKSR